MNCKPNQLVIDDIFDAHWSAMLKELQNKTNCSTHDLTERIARGLAYDAKHCIPANGETIVTDTGIMLYRDGKWLTVGVDGAYNETQKPTRFIPLHDIIFGLAQQPTTHSRAGRRIPAKGTHDTHHRTGAAGGTTGSVSATRR